MSLINCNECGKSISDKAPSCPQCGLPIAGSSFSPSYNSSSSSGSSPGGCATTLGGIGMIAIGGLVCIVAFKVFNFIIGAVGGILAFIGIMLMNFAG